MSFAELKKKSQSNLSFLQKELEKTVSNKQVDERFWKPEVDASGNGYAVIRFLPAPDGETVPWAKVYSHAFQGPGGWYIENSLTTIGDKDPVGEVNRRLWNSGEDADKDTARKQKRKLSYYSNIYVVKDPTNPENEGKVFLYKFGKKIFDKIYDLMNPDFADETPVDPFDFWEGADFKLKIRNVEGYRNYDKSEFASPAALLNADEAKLEDVYNKLHDLSEFTNPKNYKSYDELKAKLMRVLGEEATAGAYTVKEEIKINEPVAAVEPVTAEEISSEDEDTLSYFSKLAKQD